MPGDEADPDQPADMPADVAARCHLLIAELALTRAHELAAAAKAGPDGEAATCASQQLAVAHDQLSAALDRAWALNAL